MPSRAAPTAKSSSHSTDNCERRPPPVTSNVAEDCAALRLTGGEGVRLTVDTNRLYMFDADRNAIH